jgi:hypothetical protein
MPVKEIEDEIRERERVRKFIFCVSLGGLILVALFFPERYAVLCFLGAVVAILFYISTKLLAIYYLKSAQSETVINLLLTIVHQLNKRQVETSRPKNGRKGPKQEETTSVIFQ